MRTLFLAVLFALPGCPRIIVTDPWDKNMKVAARAAPGASASSTAGLTAAGGSGEASAAKRGPLLAQAPGEGPRADASVSNTNPEARFAALPTRKGGETELARSALQAALLAGPQRFMANILLDPFFIEGRFVGFTLTRFYEGDRRFSAIDLRRGDVVTRVNNLPIGRPHQFMRAWDDLRTADEIRVEYLRGAEKRVLRVKLTGDATKTPLSAGGGPIDE